MDSYIYVRGLFSDEDQSVLKVYTEELNAYNIKLCTENIKGSIFHAALDFFPLETLVVSFELLKNLVYSGSYDIIKYYIIKLWNLAKTNRNRIPFFIQIKGIPVRDNEETIRCQVSEPLSDELKELVIDRFFDLASQIEQHKFELMERNPYYDAIGAHIFGYEKEDGSFFEIDTYKEIRRKLNDDSEQ